MRDGADAEEVIKNVSVCVCAIDIDRLRKKPGSLSGSRGTHLRTCLFFAQLARRNHAGTKEKLMAPYCVRQRDAGRAIKANNRRLQNLRLPMKPTLAYRLCIYRCAQLDCRLESATKYRAGKHPLASTLPLFPAAGQRTNLYIRNNPPN